MKKYRGKIIGYAVLLLFLAWVGFMAYDQISANKAYPDEAIGIQTRKVHFGQDTTVRVEFASKTLRSQGRLVYFFEKDQSNLPTFYWQVKQGARVLQEMPLDNIERQTDKGRLGTYSISIKELWSPLTVSLYDLEGYIMQGQVIYSTSVWPTWPTGTDPDKTLQEMGIYRRYDAS